MPICAIHLLSLHRSTTISHFIRTLNAHRDSVKPLVISRIIRWIILPTILSTPQLLAKNIHWDLLLILPSTEPLLGPLQTLVLDQWTVYAGVPSRLLQNFSSKNNKLLHPEKSTIPKLTTNLKVPRVNSSAQGLELSPELRSWMETFGETRGGNEAVSMLNLLAFKKGMKGEYLKYGAEFAKSIGAKRGGNAKIVGSVIHEVESKREKDGEEWDEVALAHYPSIWHFADMLASDDYQAVNQKHRVPSLKDTFILCTTELNLEDKTTSKL